MIPSVKSSIFKAQTIIRHSHCAPRNAYLRVIIMVYDACGQGMWSCIRLPYIVDSDTYRSDAFGHVVAA